MKVQELTQEQLNELKQNYYTNVLHQNENVSYDELANINTLVTDKEVFDHYAHVNFVNDDFFS